MYSLKARLIKNHLTKLSFLPGLFLTSAISVISYFLFHILEDGFSFSAVSTVSIALFFSIITTNIWIIPKEFHLGIHFSLNRVLTLAIILLGFRLDWADVAIIGKSGLFIIVFSLLFTFTSTYYVGRHLGLNIKLIQLIACGTSICGTSAIVATNSIIRASEEDVACAVVTVTAFGSLAMILYPFLSAPLGLTPQEFGLWCGSSIHQTSQVVAAGFQHGSISGELATVSKLSRVIFLAPTIFCIGLFKTSTAGREKSSSATSKLPIPLFVVLFLCVICLNSLNIIPDNIKNFIIEFDKFLITVSMAAVGLETKLGRLKQAGLKPLILGALSWLCLALMSLLLIKSWT